MATSASSILSRQPGYHALQDPLPNRLTPAPTLTIPPRQSWYSVPQDPPSAPHGLHLLWLQCVCQSCLTHTQSTQSIVSHEDMSSRLIQVALWLNSQKQTQKAKNRSRQRNMFQMKQQDTCPPCPRKLNEKEMQKWFNICQKKNQRDTPC